mmetsp:Transcript_136735/g.340949  ORF Transcript_136735/g.340949 Transcript_136735/m.340949 type:complete len:382 (+) Transcript_136735:76-1221(+)
MSSKLSTLALLHERNELFEVQLLGYVLRVPGGDARRGDLVPLGLRDACRHLRDDILVLYSPGVCGVKLLEALPQLLPVDPDLSFDECGDELLVPDPLTVWVQRSHDLIELFVAHLVADMLHAPDKLLWREQAVSLSVERHELVPQLLDLELRELAGQELQDGPPQLVVRLILHQPLEDRDTEPLDVPVGRRLGRVLEPRVRQSLRSAEPILRRLLQELPTQVDGFLGDRLPDVRGELHRLGSRDLRTHGLLVVAGHVEGVPSCEQLAQNDPDAKDVGFLVVVLLYHLRGHVVRGPSPLHFLLSLMMRDQVLAIHCGQDPRELARHAAPQDLDLLGRLPDLLREVGQAEVDDLEGRAGAAVDKKDVLGLDVSVDEAPVVQEG